MLAQECNSPPDERFWTMAGSVALYGGIIAKELGLCNIDMGRMRKWVVSAIKNMRSYKSDNTFDPVSFLGSMLDRHSASTLVVDSWDPTESGNGPVLKEPKQHLVARHELSNNRLWISYDTIKYELHKIHISSKKLASTLKERGLMTGTTRITLGRGTLYGSIAQLCWEFDLSVPELKSLKEAVIAVGHKKEK
jgi:hypothetical protein